MDTPIIQHKVSLADFYVTNIKFNAPSPNAKFGDGLTFKLNHETSYDLNLDNQRFFIFFNLHITNQSQDFDLILTALASFKTDQVINSEFMDSHFPNVNCPAIAFPYIRSYVTNLISSSGYQPIYLPSINFSANFNPKNKETPPVKGAKRFKRNMK